MGAGEFVEVASSVDLCRVTVVAPDRRVDVALPADRTVATLLPVLVRAAGDGLADRGSWVLQRVGDMPLDLGATLGQSGIRDGEILHLRPADDPIPEPAFDDLADAIATGRRASPTWSAADSRRAGLLAGAGALALLAGLLGAAGPPWSVPALASTVVAVALLAAAAAVSRALGDAGAGTVLACAGIGFAAVAGSTAAGVLRGAGAVSRGELGGAVVLGAAATVLVAAVLGAMAVGDAVPLFTGLAVGALIVVLGAGLDLLTSLGDARSAAVVATVTLALTQFVPWLSLRLAELPHPTVPLTGDDVRRDDAVIAGADVIRRAVLAERHVTGLIGAAAVVGVAAEVVLSLRADALRLSLVAVLASVTGLRARVFTGRWQRWWLLGAAAAGGVAVAVAAADGRSPGSTVLAVGAPLVVVGVSLFVSALVLPGRRVLPVTARFADLVDGLFIVGLLPLLLAVLDVYSAVRSLRG